jgi:hypothetical protein
MYYSAKKKKVLLRMGIPGVSSIYTGNVWKPRPEHDAMLLHFAR